MVVKDFILRMERTNTNFSNTLLGRVVNDQMPQRLTC